MDAPITDGPITDMGGHIIGITARLSLRAWRASQPALPAPPGTVSPSVAAYCAKKFRSYDPVTGTYLSSGGMRLVCTYP